MNDSNFSSDTYFCFQDLSTSHIAEADQSNAFGYFNSLGSGLPAQQQQQHTLHNHLQFSPLASGQSSSQQSSHGQQNGLLCNVNNNNNGNNNNTNNSILNSLPFVQIHTTDVHPSRSSYGNVFRRNTTNQDEIKSEPIKSENSESNIKDNANTTPTPPTVQGGGNINGSNVSNERLSPTHENSICNHEHMAELHKQRNIKNGSEININNNLKSVNENGSLPKIYKCSHCTFISLSEAVVQQHVNTTHPSNSIFPTEIRQRITCPGCDNLFYAHNSLYVHLCEDHRMSLDEANQFLEAVIQMGPYSKDVDQQSHLQHHVDAHTKDTQPKIFLKNVECLREPAPRPLDEQLMQLNDNNYFQMSDFGCGVDVDDGCGALLTDVAAPESDYLGIPNAPVKDLTLIANSSPKQQSPPKQKISIKSVDVLREPALLRRDFEMQNINILGGGQCNDHDFRDTLESDSQFNYGSTLNLDDSAAVTKEVSAFEKPRRPKIYIKNVDILKEPIVLPTNLNVTGGGLDFNYMPQNTGSFLGSVNSEVVTTQAQVFNGTAGAHLCMGNLVDSSLLYDGSASNNFLQNITELDTFAMAQNSGNNFLLEASKYQSELQTLNTNLTSSGTPQPTVTEPTPPPPPLTTLQQPNQFEIQTATSTIQQKQKIFIKNVDILKQPQFQEQRRTLHLRTVDELNLMNKTEVENLIAPNLDGPQNSTLNQDYVEVNNNLSAENSKTSFSSLNLKINDCDDTQGLHNWTGGYSLGAELDSIITEHTQAIAMGAEEMALQKQLYDLETPQMSVISILDIEELTDGQDTPPSSAIMKTSGMQMANEVAFDEHEVVSVGNSKEILPQSLDDHIQQHSIDQNAAGCVQNVEGLVETSEELKREQQISVNQTSEPRTPTPDKPELLYAASTKSPILSEQLSTSCSKETSFIPLPVPSVPSPTTPTQYNSTLTTSAAPDKAPEKGRIYVADNLMEVATERAPNQERPLAVSITGGTSNRGRPFGSNRTGITKIRKLYGNAAAIDVGMKCNVQGCAFRFKKPETLDYHKRCHTGNSVASQLMMCPECQSTNFSNWNTLHTHLWRAHQIDMELYSCELCKFKTPIYSRLVNTHSKIHSEERNYKCDQCEKAFKNSKQLKNHRRWHRNALPATPATTAAGNGGPNQTAPPLHRCKDCGSAFSHQKTLREHVCKENPEVQKVLRCDICERVVSSKSSLKLHMRTHETASRFKCTICDYRANDHNAFRRHKMTHDKSRMYLCPYCDYKSIQSVAYQKHVQQKHPKLADNIVLKCGECNFSTINGSLLTIHMAKHTITEDDQEAIATAISDKKLGVDEAKSSTRSERSDLNTEGINKETENKSSCQQQQKKQQRNKIKVKSDLVLTDPSKFAKYTNSNNVTSRLMHCFENAVT